MVHVHPLYNTWKKMRQRCYNPRAEQYRYYGGKGIRVCERWATFSNFVADMGERPAAATLDRIDTSGDYAPANCRWATKAEQNRNRSNCMRIVVGDRVLCGAEVARMLRIDRKSVYSQSKRRPDRFAARVAQLA